MGRRVQVRAAWGQPGLPGLSSLLTFTQAGPPTPIIPIHSDLPHLQGTGNPVGDPILDLWGRLRVEPHIQDLGRVGTWSGVSWALAAEVDIDVPTPAFQRDRPTLHEDHVPPQAKVKTTHTHSLDRVEFWAAC